MVRSTGVPSAVFSRYFASQIWREIGAIRSETDPIIASTFISMALPYLSPRGIAPAILRSGQGRCSDGHRGACGLLLRRPRCEGDRRDPVRRPPAGLLSCRRLHDTAVPASDASAAQIMVMPRPCAGEMRACPCEASSALPRMSRCLLRLTRQTSSRALSLPVDGGMRVDIARPGRRN